MKSILSKKYSIFVACIAVIAAVALFGSALTLSVSGKGTIPDQNSLPEKSAPDAVRSSKMGKPEIEPQQYRPLLRKKEEPFSDSDPSSSETSSGWAEKHIGKRRRPRKRSALRSPLRRPTL